MKVVFLMIWALLFLPLGGFTLMAIGKTPSNYWSYLILSGITYVGFCSWRLIQESYRPRDLFEPSNAGYWLCLLLLPLCLLPLLGAYKTWQQGVYVSSSSGNRTYLSSLLLEGVQALVGHWGPIVLMLVAGVGSLMFLLNVIQQYRR
jgi:hypothetical protein